MAGECLTPAMARLLQSIQRIERPPFHAMGVPGARRSYDAAAEVLDLPRAPLARVEDLRIPARDGEVFLFGTAMGHSPFSQTTCARAPGSHNQDMTRAGASSRAPTASQGAQ